MYKVLDLFSGIGGGCLGIYVAGLAHVFEPHQFIEWDAYCSSILKNNFPSVPVHCDDIKDFQPIENKFDIILASPPCQPHSVAGKRKGSEDERDLWAETLRIITSVKPKAFIIENVPGFRTTEQGDFFKRVLADIANAGYDAEWGHLTVSAVGGVHKRKRLFVIAYPISQRQSRWEKSTKTGTDITSLATNITLLSNWSQVKSTFCGMDDGFSSGMDWLLTYKDLDFALERAADNDDKPLRKHQIKALGNAINPQQAAQVWLRLFKILNYGNTN